MCSVGPHCFHASRLMMHAKRQLFIESHAGSDEEPSALCPCWAHNGVLPFKKHLWHAVSKLPLRGHCIGDTHLLLEGLGVGLSCCLVHVVILVQVAAPGVQL